VSATAPALITLDLPENVDLKVLIDYVSRRLGVNIIYDEQAVAQKITVRAPTAVPESSLLAILEGALRSKNLALVDADAPGWKRVVAVQNLAAAGGRALTTQPAGARPGEIVTRVFQLRYADVAKADQVAKPFLTQPGGNSLQVPESQLLVVTDYAATIAQVAELIDLVDRPRAEAQVAFVPLQHLEAAQLAPQVMQLLSAKLRIRSGGGTAPVVEISSDPRSNQLIVIAPTALVEEARQIAASLDRPGEAMITRAYTMRSVSPERIDALVQQMLGTVQAKRLYQSTIDREGNALVVTGPASVHVQVEALRADLDVPVPEAQSPVRLYKLKNATAADVLATIQAIEGQEGFEDVAVEGSESAGGPPPGTDMGPVPGPLSQAAPALTGLAPGSGSPLPAATGLGGSGPRRLPTVRTAQATVTADANTNTIIVVAAPAVQRIYEQLIASLDKRRPQVLIEATIVAIDTSNDLSLGVEIGYVDSDGTKVIAFSKFGLSEVGDGPDLGRLSLVPGIGFNGAVINTSVADVVVRALRTSSRANVLSAPRILVNDNATGTLESVAESPYVSTNASDTVATTSFAGYAQAGTQIAVTPHIAEGDHLKLDYQITLNTFTGAGANGIPPPRQTDTIQSEVTIPDGDTVIVGGLNRRNTSKTKSAIPILGDIPGLDLLFSSRTNSHSDSTLFVFLRPVVLRDDQFADLKYYSQADQTRAGLPPDWPVSEPVELESSLAAEPPLRGRIIDMTDPDQEP
jgi:general secretion pathway protein D